MEQIMSDPIQAATDRLVPIFKVVDEVLSEWSKDKSGDGCLQFPVLMGMMVIKTNWTDKQVRENDPFIRWYVRNHPEWHVTRGAHGGIMKAEDKQKKEAVKNAKIAAKADMKAALEAELAAKKAAPVVDATVDSESDSSDSE
jgi:hypothetical protein